MRTASITLALALASSSVGCFSCAGPAADGEGEGEGSLPIGEGEGVAGEGEGEGVAGEGEGEGAIGEGEGEGAAGEGEGEGAAGEGEGEGSGGCARDIDCDVSQLCTGASSTSSGTCAASGEQANAGVAIDELRYGSVHAIELTAAVVVGAGAGAGVDVHGFTLKRSDGASATIRAASDPTGLVGTAVVVGGGAGPATGPGYGAVGVVESGAQFVVGDAGTTFRLPTSGALALYDANGARVDVVTFGDGSFGVGNNDTALGGVRGNRAIPIDPTGAHTTQLDQDSFALVGPLDARTANDDGSQWCIDSSTPGTLGAANIGCARNVRLNEVLYDYKALGDDDDSGRQFIELRGPAFASLEQIEVVIGNNASAIVFTRPPGSPLATRLNASGLYVIADDDGGAHAVPNSDQLTALALPDDDGSVQVCFDTVPCDALSWGAGTGLGFGASVVDVDPGSMSLSIARDAGDGSYHLDPTPTPGAENDGVAAGATSALSPDNGLATSTTTTGVGVRDVADSKTQPVLQATFAGVSSTCGVSALVDEGRGGAVLSCSAGDAGGVAERGDFVVSSAGDVAAQTGAASSNSAIVASGWRYTGVLASGVQFCNVQFPQGTASTAVNVPITFFSQVHDAAFTEAAGFDPRVIDEIGVGAFGDDPRSSSNAYLWSATVQSVANTGFLNHNDEYKSDVVESAPGTVGVLFRVSVDGGLDYTYCDGDDTNENTVKFDPNAAASLTITP